MSEPLVATPADGWTTDDLDQLPVSNYRYELTDGALTVSPSASSLHNYICLQLVLTLEGRAPDDIAVTHAVEVRFGKKLTRIPDVLAVRSAEPVRHWFAPDELVLAVEVESPGGSFKSRAERDLGRGGRARGVEPRSTPNPVSGLSRGLPRARPSRSSVLNNPLSNDAGNHIEDRVTKPAIYAQFGIPHYWRIDPRALTVTAYQLDPDAAAYRVAESGERLVVSKPFPASFSVSELFPRWAR